MGNREGPESPSPSPTRTRHQGTAESNNGGDDSMSVMSDNTNASNLSVWAQAKMILTGQNPNAIVEEPDEDEMDVYVPQSVSARIDSFENNMSQQPQRSVRFNTSITDDDKARNTDPGMHDADFTSESHHVDFLQDRLSDMTWSRRIAVFLMKRYSWYNPRLNHPPTKMEESAVENDDNHSEENYKLQQNGSATSQVELLLNDAYPFTESTRENPRLESAWAYFEHVALPRYISVPKELGWTKKNIFIRFVRKCFMKGNKQLQRAEPGEKELETALYHPIFTPHKQLGDFGLGIGLYFSTLRAITVLMLLAGLLNTANIVYFNSPEYNNPENVRVINETLKTFVQGSAICTDTSWVLCTDCENHTDSFGERVVRGRNEDAVTYFALRNNCEGATIQQGLISYATLLFIMIGTIILNVYLTRMEVAFDEDEQTSQDYSVIVENPPHDATNPQEWHDFFKEKFGAHVTACTVAVDNDLLIRTLVTRRELLRKIELLVDPGTSLDTLTIARIATKQERERRVLARLLALISPGVPEFFSQLTVMTAKVQGLAQQHYPATNIFLSFETEKAQREVLEAYNLGSLDVSRNNASKMKNPDQHLFRGKLVLKVSEPDEPNTVRWQDLNEKFKDRVKQQLLTISCTVAAIFLIAFIVWLVNSKKLSKSATAYTIAVFNAVFPMFAKFLTSFEAHSSASDVQRSLYFKIALFRWVNTAVVITIITPFTSTLSNGELIDQIYALFFADITTTNAIQLLDPWGHIQRHILAPRANTQDAMNLKMQGAVFELAERYTNMTKILFLALWYCALYPGALYLCSVSLLVMYFVDRFSLMRTWKRAPHLGSKISQFSRRYFFPMAIIAMALVSSYYWACFPFDNLCETGTVSEFSGTWKLVGVAEAVSLDEEDVAYKYCIQDFFRFPRKEDAFPFIPKNQIKGSEWMTEDQEIIANIYGWSAIGVIFIIMLSIVWKWYLAFMTMFRGTYEPCGEDMGINFSDVPSMNSYVPEISSPVFAYPLLAANIDNIDTDLLDWTDPDRPHSYYDLTKDAEVLLRGKNFGNNIVFSQIAHWPPPGKEKKKKKKRKVN